MALVLLLPLIASAVIALVIVRGGRSRAQARLAEVPGTVMRTSAATSLGLSSQAEAPVRGTGTVVLTDLEVAFAQWRPDRLLRIPRASIVETDTTREHLGRTMNGDVLRIRWRTDDGTEDCVALFLRDLDPWLADLGGTRREA